MSQSAASEDGKVDRWRARLAACTQKDKTKKMQLYGLLLDPETGAPLLDAQGRPVFASDAASCEGPVVWVSDPNPFPISGFYYLKNFVSNGEERRLLAEIDSNPWSKVFRRRQQFYGEVYYHTAQEVADVQPTFMHSQEGFEGMKAPDRNEGEQDVGHRSTSSGSTSSPNGPYPPCKEQIEKVPGTSLSNGLPLPCKEQSEKLPGTTTTQVQPLDITVFDWFVQKFYEESIGIQKPFGHSKESFPTQMLMNEYIGNFGISSHFEDEAAFGDTIATISLNAPILFTLQKPKEHTNQCQDLEGEVKVLLEPGSLMIMSEDCRFKWRHGITRHQHVHMPDGTLVVRDEKYRRVSITIRHLLSGRKQVKPISPQ